MIRYFILLGIMRCITFPVLAQEKVDVYQNKRYEVSSHLWRIPLDRDYLSAELEIWQDTNVNGNKAWRAVEHRLKDIAIRRLSSDSEYFSLPAEVKKILGQTAGRSEYNTTGADIDFVDIGIELLSMVNGFGTYRIAYSFEVTSEGAMESELIFVLSHYLADYANNRIIPIATPLSLSRQEALKEVSLPKFKKLYLLRSQKLELSDINGIRNIEAQAMDVEPAIDFSEAIVFPCFSGLMVEFPALSVSSKIFNWKSSRVLLREDELGPLLSFFPEFKPVFKQTLKVRSQEMQDRLNEDDNFDLTRYREAPKELKILEILDLGKKLNSMTVTNFKLKDTGRVLLGSKTFHFDKDGFVSQIEHKNAKDKILKEEKYGYDEKGKLLSAYFSDSENGWLVLHHYQKNALSCIEKVFGAHGSTHKSNESTDKDIQQEHFAYNSNYRYSIEFSLLDELDENDYTYDIDFRVVEDQRYCTNYYCIILDENKRAVSVKYHNNFLIDILVNDEGQPLESYFDHNRHHNFMYDDNGKLRQVETFSEKKLIHSLMYNYSEDDTTPLIISDSKTLEIQEYKMEYR